ncbi:MAG: GNAT family N-acetyltransferase [Pseudomonadota bacterium]
MSALDLVREIERVERDAWADIYEAAPEHVRADLGLQARRIGESLLLICAGIDNLQFNRLIGLGVFTLARGEEVDEAIAAFDAAGVGDWVIHFADGAEGVELACGSRDLSPHPRAWAKFARDASPAAEVGTVLQIREVGRDEADRFGETVAEGFGLPQIMGDWLSALPGRDKWKCFVAFDGEAPVGAGALFIDGANAWLGMGATLAAHRGRGAQPAILAARIEAARASGCQILSTETGIPGSGEAGPSYKNIHRAGFLIAYPRPNLRRA